MSLWRQPRWLLLHSAATTFRRRRLVGPLASGRFVASHAALIAPARRNPEKAEAAGERGARSLSLPSAGPWLPLKAREFDGLGSVICDGAHAHPAAHIEDTLYLAVDGVAARHNSLQDRVDSLFLKDVALAEAREEIS